MLDQLIRRCGKEARVRRVSISGTWGDKNHNNVTNLTLDIGGKHVSTQARGDGPIDATFKAILSLCGIEGALQKYEALTKDGVGSAGSARITVWLRFGHHVYKGIAECRNTNVGAADACLVAINKIVRDQRSVHRRKRSERTQPAALAESVAAAVN